MIQSIINHLILIYFLLNQFFHFLYTQMHHVIINLVINFIIIGFINNHYHLFIFIIIIYSIFILYFLIKIIKNLINFINHIY